MWHTYEVLVNESLGVGTYGDLSIYSFGVGLAKGKGQAQEFWCYEVMIIFMDMVLFDNETTIVYKRSGQMLAHF